MNEYQTGPSIPVSSPPDIPAIMRRTRPWVYFFGILTLVGTGLMVCGALFFLAVSLNKEPLAAAIGVTVYVIAAAVNAFIGICLLRYASRIARYVANPQEELLADALEAQRVYWKFIGILAIVGICLAALTFLVAIIVQCIRNM